MEGGDDNDVAEAILYHKGIGCYTNGTTEVTVTDQNDYVNKVRFYRPTYVDVHVRLKIKKYTGYVNSLQSTIKDAIYNYLGTLEIGRDVSISMLMGVVMSCNAQFSRPVFGIAEMTVGRSTDSLVSGDMDINFNEVANANYDAIQVSV